MRLAKVTGGDPLPNEDPGRRFGRRIAGGTPPGREDRRASPGPRLRDCFYERAACGAYLSDDRSRRGPRDEAQ